MTRCPDCSEDYVNLGRHLGAKSISCNYPDLTQRQSDIITGLMMGDGSVTGSKSTDSSNPYLQVQMVSEEFLSWLDEELGIYSNGYKLEYTAEEQANRNNSSGEYQDVYSLTTMRAPIFDQWDEWYGDDGKKRFPEVRLTPVVAGVWYACDGWKNEQSKSGRPYACIGAANETKRCEAITKAFKEKGFESSWIRRSVRLTADASEEFWGGSSSHRDLTTSGLITRSYDAMRTVDRHHNRQL